MLYLRHQISIWIMNMVTIEIAFLSKTEVTRVDGKMALVTLFHGSIYLDAVDVSDLNNIIDLNQNFIDFMLNYRNDIYAPIRTAQLDAEKERKEAQRGNRKLIGCLWLARLSGPS